LRGQIRKRGDSWAVIVSLGRDPLSGKYRKKWHTVYGTKKEAERELARLLHQVHSGEYVEPAKTTVREFLERCLRDCIRPAASASTYTTYEIVMRRYLVPSLGNISLSRLQPAVIQTTLRGLLEKGRANGRGGLSPATVLKAYALLHRACEQAVKWGILARNPCQAVNPPRLVRQEPQVWDEEQTRLFLGEARRSGHYPVYLAAITTGMRQSEILGLRWRDVDFVMGFASVSQICYRGTFKEPKTAKSRRSIALPKILLHRLQDVREMQTEHRRRLGQEYEDNGLVFAQENGKPLCVRNLIRRDFEPLMKRAGVPRIRFHDLRHLHATFLLRAGIHPKVVSERLGHSRVGVTLDIYSHVVPGLQEQAAHRVDALLGDLDR